MDDRVKALIKDAPNAPGIYVFKNSDNVVIYVGKAKSLKNRLKSYVSKDADAKLRALQEHISNLELIRTANEIEALILESNLIKKYKPRYNILLKDDKAYPYIKINTKRDWPRLEFVRRAVPDGAMYFGPYTSSKVLKELLSVLNKAFPLRKCSDTVLKASKRPCLNYEIGRCLAPCCGLIKREEYQGIINGVLAVLKGDTDVVIKALEKEMFMAADSLNFEEAAKAREKVKALHDLSEGKAVIIPGDDRDIDVISYAQRQGLIAFNIMFLRNGAIIGQLNFIFESDDLMEVTERFLVDYYMRNMIPDEILLPFELGDQTIVALIKERGMNRTKVLSRTRRELKKVRMLGEQNLELYLRSYLSQGPKWDSISLELSKLLGSSSPIWSIECFDMSNISGTGCVGAKVRFDGGRSSKDGYRKYRIKGDFKGDDLKMMNEVLSRRLNKIEEEPLPDLMLIDGGKTQLKTVYAVFHSKGVNIRSLCSIAKDRTISKGASNDKIYHIDDNGMIFRLDVSQTLLNFLKRVRDEAHRFVITFHRQVRQKRSFE